MNTQSLTIGRGVTLSEIDRAVDAATQCRAWQLARRELMQLELATDAQVPHPPLLDGVDEEFASHHAVEVVDALGNEALIALAEHGLGEHASSLLKPARLCDSAIEVVLASRLRDALQEIEELVAQLDRLDSRVEH